MVALDHEESLRSGRASHFLAAPVFVLTVATMRQPALRSSSACLLAPYCAPCEPRAGVSGLCKLTRRGHCQKTTCCEPVWCASSAQGPVTFSAANSSGPGRSLRPTTGPGTSVNQLPEKMIGDRGIAARLLSMTIPRRIETRTDAGSIDRPSGYFTDLVTQLWWTPSQAGAITVRPAAYTGTPPASHSIPARGLGH